MKLAIVGSRDFKNLDAVRAFVRMLAADTEIITGGAGGVDSAAEDEARRRGMRLTVIRPDYRAHHPALAPKIRNREISRQCEGMVAFWDGVSGGTANVTTWAAFYDRTVVVVIPAEQGEGETATLHADGRDFPVAIALEKAGVIEKATGIPIEWPGKPPAEEQP